MKDLVIVGTALFGEVARDYFHEYTEYRVRAFSCHEKNKDKDSFCGAPVIPIESLDESFDKDEASIFVAIGYKNMNRARENTFLELKQRGYQFATFVHPNVKIWKSSTIGENVFIFENNVIQPSVAIGDNSILWSGNHIGHHSNIGKNCFISSHVVVSGSCTVGDNSFLGVNSTIHDSVSLGKENLVGAGAIISKNSQDKAVYVPGSTKLFPKSSDQLEF